MPQKRSPRRGSLAFYPKKRAARIYPALSTYPQVDKPKFLDFAGYKAAMLHAILMDNRKGSPTFGQEIFRSVTVIECPPMKVLGIRAYRQTDRGLKVFNEKISEIEKNLDKVFKIRLIVSTQPKLSGIGKKTVELFETSMGGKDVKENFAFAKEWVNKEIAAKDVFKEGELVDVVAVTTGKGTAGPVKRFGVTIQSRHAKEKRRHVGTLGQERPGKVRPTVPMRGQLGFQTRTELNKRILKIGEKGEEITPKSGIRGYGLVKSNYILLEGSIPGPKKRLIRLRAAIRPSKVKLLVPEIREVVR